MTNQVILDYLPNSEHLRDLAIFLRRNNPTPGSWNDWEFHAKILSVWADQLDKLAKKLTEEQT